MKPSEYWHRQCLATYQSDPVGMRLLDLLGEDNVMWGSDFPHPDGVWPDSREFLQRETAGLPHATRRKPGGRQRGAAVRLRPRRRRAQRGLIGAVARLAAAGAVIADATGGSKTKGALIGAVVGGVSCGVPGLPACY